MKNVTHHIGKFEIIRREKNSLSGNPRWLCRVDGWTCYTAPNAQLGYTASNYDGKQVEADLGTLRGRCTVESVHLA